MSSTNLGNQTVLFDFKNPAKGGEFNKLLRNIIKPGIFSGAEINVVGGWGASASATIDPFTVGLEESDLRFIVIHATSPIEYIIPSSEPYLYCTYEWSDIIENWLDFNTAADLIDIPEGAIIFGKANFSGGVITSWDYTDATYNPLSVFNWEFVYNRTNESLRVQKDGNLILELFENGSVTLLDTISFDSSTGRMDVDIVGGAGTRQLQLAPDIIAMMNTVYGNAPDGFGANRITINDGSGNFNIRGGCYNDFNLPSGTGDDRYATDDGGAIHIRMLHNSSEGNFQIKLAPANPGVAGDIIVWGKEISITNDNNINVIQNGVTICSLTSSGDLYIIGEIHEVTTI